MQVSEKENMETGTEEEEEEEQIEVVTEKSRLDFSYYVLLDTVLRIHWIRNM